MTPENSSKERLSIDISYQTFVKAIVIALVVGFLYLIRDIILIVFVAMVLAAALTPMVEWFHKKVRFPRAVSVLVIYLLFLAIVSSIVVLMVPPIVEQVRSLASLLPAYFSGTIGEISLPDDKDLAENLSGFLSTLSSQLGKISQSFIGGVSQLFGGIFSLIMILVLTFYLLIQEKGLQRFVSILPTKHEAYLIDLTTRIQLRIGSWFRGQMLLALVVGVLIFIGLFSLGIKFALVLALFAGLMEIVPIVGPIISAIPAIFLASTQNPWLALAVLALFVIVQQLENNVLVPKIMSRAVGLEPIIVIIVVLIGSKLGGILGMLLSVPIATVFSVFINDLFGERFRTDKKEKPAT